MSKRIRQSIGILAAVAAYYLIHEGAHLVTALCWGTFRQINFLGLGMQIDVYADAMTNTQLGIFCLAGPAATFAAGWLLITLAKNICKARSKVIKAVMWYVSLTMLLLDPLYLSILCSFFGGGDMNGIALLIPQIPARLAFGSIGILHGAVIWKYLLPLYTNAFQQSDTKEEPHE